MDAQSLRSVERTDDRRAERARRGDLALERLVGAGVAVGVVIVLLVVVSLASNVSLAALPSTLALEWNPGKERFGIVAPALATLATTAIAGVSAVPVAIVAALWIVEAAPLGWRSRLLSLLHLGAVVPSVVYGLWASSTIVPWVQSNLGRPAGPGLGLLTSSLGLAAMIAPSVASIAADVVARVPVELRRAAIALGATHWEVVARVVVPTARRALAGAALLGLGRATGEAVLVSMLIGGRVGAPLDWLGPSSTLGSLLLAEWIDATRASHLGALAAAAMVLLAMSVGLQVLARRWLASTFEAEAR